MHSYLDRSNLECGSIIWNPIYSTYWYSNSIDRVQIRFYRFGPSTTTHYTIQHYNSYKTFLIRTLTSSGSGSVKTLIRPCFFHNWSNPILAFGVFIFRLLCCPKRNRRFFIPTALTIF
ncbi:unnamed protein product [Ceratitis capitata]|uniref:(Mediterranean fruit fly) hypothetical protein n=1 Tax=Ceratitis capitata TaxID=7213 RepID=A0A811UW80_CERCA|nr:unnamed protein product [Ceratitis capitata]